MSTPLVVTSLWFLFSARKRRLLEKLGDAGAASPASAVRLQRPLHPVETAAAWLLFMIVVLLAALGFILRIA